MKVKEHVIRNEIEGFHKRINDLEDERRHLLALVSVHQARIDELDAALRPFGEAWDGGRVSGTVEVNMAECVTAAKVLGLK